MAGSLVTVIAAAAEPFGRQEVKDHLRITSTDDDAQVDALIARARDWIEDQLHRALVVQTLDYALDGFPESGPIWLPRSPVRAVSSISYVDENGATQTWATAKWQADLKSTPARIYPAWGEAWPSVREQLNAVTVRFVAGHAVPFSADAPSDVLTGAGHNLVAGDAIQLANHHSSTGGVLPAPLAAATNYYVRDVSGDTLKLATTAGGAAIDITSAGTGKHFLGAAPGPILQAMLLLIGHWYENREAVNIGNIVTEIPWAAAALLGPWRVLRF